MSLLALLNAKSAAVDPLGPLPVYPEQALPYTLPTAAPYQVSHAMITPTYDGSGSTVHPSVVDMVAEGFEGGFRGWRYWMGITPYNNSALHLENPSILVSNNGFHWHVPDGLTNPLDDPRTSPDKGGAYNSDTELVWDPERKRLWCYWRESVNKETGEIIWCGWTADGITWSPRIKLFSTDYDTGTLSPTVVRVAADHWRMYYIGDRGAPSGFRTAPRPEGPWSEHVNIRFNTGLGDQFNTYAWHVYMRYEYGQFRMVLNTRANQAAWRLRPAVSNDGINFILGDAIQSPGRYAWERQHYRTCIVPADNGVDYDVWYSDTGSGWRVAYTQWPKKHWWDLDPRLTA